MTYMPITLDDLASLAEEYQDALREYEALVEMRTWGSALEEAEAVLVQARRDFKDAVREFSDQ